ncbi:MAG TPA: sulfite exporter TauE/SafE family protein [Candidatus Limnocylindrales bacterium]
MIDGVLLIGGGVAAGLFGSLLGLGGGTLIVPILTLGFGLALIKAIGVSLICVIVTSGAAAGVYLERRVANLRLGMTLELFTACGALIGGLVAFLLPERVLELLFTGLLVYVAVTMARRREPARAAVDAETTDDPDVIAASDAPADDGVVADESFAARMSRPGYRVHRLGFGVVGSVGAGIVSALLGIGGGLIKVPVMHVVMGVPLRVATATSNLMIGITGSAGAIVYLLRGGIDPYVAAPTAIGVFVGASIGSRAAHRIDLRILRGLFVAILLYTAWQMLQRALA